MPKLRFVDDLTARFFHLLQDRKANVAVIFALVMVPTIYLLGMTLDYSQVARKRAQLNAAADAAVIAAVTPTMLTQPPLPPLPPQPTSSTLRLLGCKALPANRH
jgi:Flp pilus assembly protein TadG